MVLVQDIVDEVLVHGVWITRARRLRGQELVEALSRLAIVQGKCKRAAGLSPSYDALV
jgi:hypothetical protein